MVRYWPKANTRIFKKILHRPPSNPTETISILACCPNRILASSFEQISNTQIVGVPSGEKGGFGGLWGVK